MTLFKKKCTICQGDYGKPFMKTMSLITGAKAYYCHQCYQMHCELYCNALKENKK